MNNEQVAGYDFKEWEKIEKQFQRDFENSTKYNKSFSELINEVLEGETEMSFCRKTELCPNMLSRLRKRVNEKNIPQKNTLISVSVGYDLDLMTTQSLLHSLGLGFNRYSKQEYAYSFLLTRCRGKDIIQCNEILENLGIEEKYRLGAMARKPKNRNKSFY